MPNYCQQIPGLGEKHTIRGSKYPIIVKNTQMLPKKYQTVAKKKNNSTPRISVSSHELHNS